MKKIKEGGRGVIFLANSDIWNYHFVESPYLTLLKEYIWKKIVLGLRVAKGALFKKSN